MRTVELAHSGQMSFAGHEHIQSCLKYLFAELAEDNSLKAASKELFCERAAYCLGELSAIHPFRDGDGRTQRAFIGQLARGSNLAVRWFQISKDEMDEASILSFQHGDSTGFERLLLGATAEIAVRAHV